MHLQQDFIPDGETTSLVWGSPNTSMPLPSHLIHMSRPSKPCFRGHPKITCGIDPVDRLPKELYLSGFRDAPNGLREKRRGALRDIDVDPPLSHAQACS